MRSLPVRLCVGVSNRLSISPSVDELLTIVNIPSLLCHPSTLSVLPHLMVIAGCSYSRAILWYMALRFCCATSFLLYSPTNQYTSIAIITTMWQLLCLLVSTLRWSCMAVVVIMIDTRLRNQLTPPSSSLPYDLLPACPGPNRSRPLSSTPSASTLSSLSTPPSARMTPTRNFPRPSGTHWRHRCGVSHPSPWR